MPLSDSRLRAMKPRETRYRMGDADGLYIEVMPTGKKIWRLLYRLEGKRHWHTIGEYPLITLQSARDKKSELKRNLAEGKDLKSQPVKKNTFGSLAEEWFAEYKQTLKNQEDARRMWNRLNTHALPVLGELDIQSIKTPDILPVLKQLTDVGSNEMAYRVRGMISRVYRYAIATGRAEYDPTYALKGVIVRPRSSHLASLTDPSQVGQLLRAIDTYPMHSVRRAMQFSALVFARPGEVRHAEWSEIDWERCEWQIRDEKKMKMGRPHIVPLARQTIEILKAQHVFTGHGRYIFPSNRSPAGNRAMSENAVRVAIRSIGYTKEQMTAHGFRSMASTLLNENGFHPDWIERQLAHIEGNSVRAAYNYAEYLKERKDMMQWYADYLDELRGRA